MRVSTAEFIDRFDDLVDRAETEPVTITHGGRDRLVLVSIDEYERLSRGRAETTGASSPELSTSELPAAWGALRDTVIFVADDIAEPNDEDWKAMR